MTRLRAVAVVGLFGLVGSLLTASAGGAARPGRVAPRPVTFLTGPNAGRPLTIALGYLRSHGGQLGLTRSDLSGAAVARRYTDRATGVTHIYLEQRHRGIGVFDGILDVNIARDGSVINVGNRFVPRLVSRVNATTPARLAVQGVADAARELGLNLRAPLRRLRAPGGVVRSSLFGKAGISLRPIPAKLVYVPTRSGVRLAWNVTVYQTGAEHLWNANVDAETGALLSKVDFVSHESYDVVPPPFEDPLDAGGLHLLVNPADPLASPFGWLDTNGVAGADSTLTIGNNAHAALDLNRDGAPDPGSEPDGGQSLVFDSPLDLPADPATIRPAAVTNLFFWLNYLHDVSYHYGFTEAAGNFQESNYGRGGQGGDSVIALDQGFVGNNSNMATPPDGGHPVMRLQLFSPPSTVKVTVHTPAQIAGDYTAGPGAFGEGTVTADVAAPSGSSLGCVTDDYSGFPAGEIALVDRGTCTFSAKVRNAQAAGAAAVIVVNNAAGFITMPSDGQFSEPPPPAVMVSQADGATLESGLPGLNATVAGSPEPQFDRDASLDDMIIAHEYTHGITSRLTGDGSGCAVNEETGNEGWSDFVALVVTAKAGQAATTPRPFASYTGFGAGDRTFPYTTDMSVNPETYDSIKQAPGLSGPETHFTGEVWASILWEVYWNLVDRYGFDPNLFDAYTAGGNTLALQLVLDGMKLQPCNPGFVDARDAIMLADRNDTGGANQCLLWQAFAKRGLGEGAQQGSSDSATDGTEDFTVPTYACGPPPDTEPPDVQITTDPSDQRASSGWYNAASSGVDGIKVNVTATDPSGVQTLRCIEGPGHIVIDKTGSTETTLTGSFVLRDGSYILGCQSMDSSGNLMTGTASAFFDVDQTPPAAFFDPHPATYTVDQTVSITCRSSDTGSGLAQACQGVSSPASSFPVGVAVTLRREASDNAGNTAIATTTFTVTVAPLGVGKLTQQFVRTSARYQALTARQKVAVDAVLTIATSALAAITPRLNAKQKAAEVALYVAAVKQLRSGGWLTQDQASTLTTLAQRL